MRLISTLIVFLALTATANAQCPGGQYRAPIRNSVKAVVHSQPVRRIVKAQPVRRVLRRFRERQPVRRVLRAVCRNRR
jgi:hypothetical protein